jgi:ppGpp synthetase/RelA/SpoT-type nucleotidyltranferase
MNNAYDELEALINYIQSVYTEITEEWMQYKTSKINLKKARVSDIDINGAIHQYILDYVRLLNGHITNITLQLSSVSSYKVTARVKAQNSIEYKIQHYKTGDHEFGKVPVNKCINDLFGVRIILDEPLTFGQIKAFVDSTYNEKYKCIDSSKHDYKAVHLYFRGNNKAFPWELQIWNSCDADKNLVSHQKYKQGYTAWEDESKEGGVDNG